MPSSSASSKHEERLQEHPRQRRPCSRSSCATTTSWPPLSRRRDAGSSRRTPGTSCARPRGYWQRYLKAETDKPDASLALVCAPGLREGALNQPEEAAEAPTITRRRCRRTTRSPISQLVASTRCSPGDKRTADLAGQKAMELAPKDQQEGRVSRPRAGAGRSSKAASRQQPSRLTTLTQPSRADPGRRDAKGEA